MTNKKNICINAANLHVGGGVQVATSFLGELLNDIPTLGINGKLTILISSTVRLNLGPENFNKLNSKFDVVEINVYGLQPVYDRRFREIIASFDVIFTVFGPDYILFSKAKRIVGFAQPWIIYPNNEVYQTLGLVSRLKTKILFKIQEMFFKQSDFWVVELEHVKERLSELGIADKDKIYVVYNSASRKYREIAEHELPFPSKKETFKLGLISRDYPHKNLSIIPDFVEKLERKVGIKIEFYVTLSEAEWHVRTNRFQSTVLNAGPQTVEQCIDFYKKVDAVFFPSLLECFSATPLEALSMCKPLFASDKPFNKDVCDSFAYYFDPCSIESMVDCVAEYILNTWGNDHEAVQRGRDYALRFSSSQQRAEQYVKILNKVTEE